MPIAGVACGGESTQRSDASPTGHAGTLAAAGQHTGGTAGSSGGAGGRTSGGKSPGGGAGGSRAGAGRGARGGADNVGEAGAAGDGGTNGLAGQWTGGAGPNAGSGGHGGAPAGGSGPFGALTPGVEAYCAAAMSCCTSPPASLEDCEADYAEQSMNLASLAAGFMTVDPEALARCLAAYSGPDQCNMIVVWAACRDVLVGTRALDETCRQGSDCDPASGETTCLILDGSDPNPLGTCIAAPRGKVGEACVSTCTAGESCSSTTYGVGDTYSLCFEDDGLYCAYVGPGYVCQELVPLGDECPGTGQECGSDALCEITCQSLGKAGESCVPGCRSELQCGTDGKCFEPTWADPDFGCKGWAPGP